MNHSSLKDEAPVAQAGEEISSQGFLTVSQKRKFVTKQTADWSAL